MNQAKGKMKAIGVLCSSVVALGVSSVLCMSGCMQSDIACLDSLGTHVVCLGDSITQGFGAGPKTSYPAYLSQQMRLSVINAGIEGDTSDGALKRIKSDVLDRQPLIVIVELGANDFLMKIPIEQTRLNVESIITQCQKQKAIVALADVSNTHLMPEYAPMFKSLSRVYKTIYIPDLLSGIYDNASMKSDCFHPNANGYKIVAQRVYRAILPYLNQNALLTKFKK